MKLITKIVGLFAVLLLAVAVVIGLSYVGMQGLGDALDEMSERNIPLSTAVNEISSNLLSQSAWLLRCSMAAQRDDADGVDNAAFEFKLLGSFVDVAIDSIVLSLEENIERAQHAEDSELHQTYRSNFDNVRTLLVQFNAEAKQFFVLLQQGEIALAEAQLPEVELVIEELTEETLAFRADVGRLTTAAAVAAKQRGNQMTQNMFVFSIAAALLSLILVLFVVRSIYRQLGADPSELVAITKSLAAGSLVMKHKKETFGVYGSISQTVKRLNEVITGIMVVSTEVNSAAHQVQTGNVDLSSRTQEQASSLEEIAASMEEMTGTVRQSADNAQRAAELAVIARDNAANGSEIVTRTIQAMTDIDESSEKIAEILDLIDDISFQTNLLALNAAVEAARAGEQGRGFAVVAAEVRQLAGRSTRASKDIKRLIKDSGKKVHQGIKLVHQAGSTLAEILDSSKEVSDLVAEISSASREQDAGIQGVAQAVAQMEEMTQANAALVEETAAASHAVRDQANTLQALIEYFEIEANQTQALDLDHQSKLLPESGDDEVEKSTGVESKTTRDVDPRRLLEPATETGKAPLSEQLAAPVPTAGSNDTRWERF